MTKFKLKTISQFDNLTEFKLLNKDIQGWNGTNNIFSELIDLTQPEYIIEIGTWKGQSAITMAHHIKENQYNSKIICVDTWLGAIEFMTDEDSEHHLMISFGYPQVYYQFISNIIHEKCEDIIIPFPNTSLIGAHYFISHGIKSQLIYIDGSHSYTDVDLDINFYWKVLDEKGIIFGDDYQCGDVKDAVDKFVNENKLDLKLQHTEKNIFWILYKNNEK